MAVAPMMPPPMMAPTAPVVEHLQVGADWRPDGPRYLGSFKDPASMKGIPPKPHYAFPPQPLMDNDPKDGPVSVAFDMQPTCVQIASKWPSPNTPQYLNRVETRFAPHPALRLSVAHPRGGSDVCGYVQAAVHDEDHTFSNKEALERNGIAHNEMRLVYGCISGWVLMFWRSQEEFTEGIWGARGAPRALAWWDLRKAWDLDIDFLDHHTETCPHRIRIMTSKGNIYFRVEHPEDVPVWYLAIKNLIQDAVWNDVRMRDTDLHKMKRWPAARGLAECLVSGSPIGERALAIAFHCYDIDYDCGLKTGEIMVLIQELVAASFANEGRAEAQDRNSAVSSASARIPQEELYDRAVRFRRRCAAAAQGSVKKDEFIMKGHGAMLEALGFAPTSGLDDPGNDPGDSCSMM